jgi:riboflavin synthase
VSGQRFDVNIIPHTHAVTSLGELQIGGGVNIEIDVIARYLERLLPGFVTIRHG